MTDVPQNSDSGESDKTHLDGASLRQLISKLSDGALTVREAEQLNVLLMDDPIAQEQYLDHLLIDGLLEMEFGFAAPGSASVSEMLQASDEFAKASESSAAQVHQRWLLKRLPMSVLLIAVLSAGMLAGACVSWGVATRSVAQPQRQSLALVDHGFESGTPVAGMSPMARLWFGDVVEIVGPHSGVTPLEGQRMLRFVKSELEPDDSCDLYQLVDIRPMLNAIANRQVYVDASAFFNTITPEGWADGCSFGLALFAYREDPSRQQHNWTLTGTQPLSFSGRHEPADGDVKTWQHVGIRLALPAETTHLLVQISVVRPGHSAAEGHIQFAGHFVDQVELAMATQN